MEFSIQEYWSGFLFLSPGDFPDPVIEPGSPALQADSLPFEPPGKLIGKERELLSAHSQSLLIDDRLLEASIICSWASLVAQMVKNLPAVQETQVQSLGWEDPMEKEMATYSSILAWIIPWTWTKEPGKLQSTGSQRDTTE